MGQDLRLYRACSCARSLSRYAVRAVLWDQGESNGGDSADYFSCLFQVRHALKVYAESLDSRPSRVPPLHRP